MQKSNVNINVCREYLTGFKKRKDVRRKKAQEQVELMIKEDKKLLRQKVSNLDSVYILFNSHN